MARILIADDSEFLRTHLRQFLQRDNWVVCGEAANGRQAVLMTSELKPDLVVLDFIMPMLNGIEAAAEILKAIPTVPIVLYTLHKNPQLDLDAANVGIRKVISKDEDANKLIASLEELLTRADLPLGQLASPEEHSIPTATDLAVSSQNKTLPKPAVGQS